MSGCIRGAGVTAGEWVNRAGRAIGYCITTGAAPAALTAVTAGQREPAQIGGAAAVGFLTCMVGLLRRSPMPSQGGAPLQLPTP